VLHNARGGELFLLATARTDKADDPRHQVEKIELYQQALRLLELARTRDPTDGMICFQIGWVLDELGRHQDAIAANHAAEQLDARVIPQARWNTAVATLKLGDAAGARVALRDIPPGPWWKEIKEDVDLQPLHENREGREEWDAMLREKGATDGDD
jgi:tetratricopeptide (TPR) repeat protein